MYKDFYFLFNFYNNAIYGLHVQNVTITALQQYIASEFDSRENILEWDGKNNEKLKQLSQRKGISSEKEWLQGRMSYMVFLLSSKSMSVSLTEK